MPKPKGSRATKAPRRKKSSGPKPGPAKKLRGQNEFRRWLRITRISRGLSQRQAAEDMGVHWRSVCLWETGVADPSLANLTKIGAWARITIDELVDKLNTPLPEAGWRPSMRVTRTHD